MVGIRFIRGGPFTRGGAFSGGGGPLALSGGLYCLDAASSTGVIDVPSDALAGVLSGGVFGIASKITTLRQCAEGACTGEAVGTQVSSDSLGHDFVRHSLW